MSIFGTYTGFILLAWALSAAVLAGLTYAIFKRDKKIQKQIQYYKKNKNL